MRIPGWSFTRGWLVSLLLAGWLFVLQAVSPARATALGPLLPNQGQPVYLPLLIQPERATPTPTATNPPTLQPTPQPTAQPTQPARQPITVDVSVGSGGLRFSPATANIQVGDTVRWTWVGSGHNVVSGSGGTADGRFCSPNDSSCSSTPTSSAGFVYSHTFREAGTFPYFCRPFFSSGMTGTVVVRP